MSLHSNGTGTSRAFALKAHEKVRCSLMNLSECTYKMQMASEKKRMKLTI